MFIHLKDNTGLQRAQLSTTKALIMGGFVTKCHEGNAQFSGWEEWHQHSNNRKAIIPVMAGTRPSKYHINKPKKPLYQFLSSLTESALVTSSTCYYITALCYHLPSCFPILPSYHCSPRTVFIMLTKHQSAECPRTSLPKSLWMKH